MQKNESNITDVTQNEEQLDNSDEQSQQNEKTFSQEEVSQLIKERIARERKKSDERIKDAVQEAEKLAKMKQLIYKRVVKLQKYMAIKIVYLLCQGNKQPNYYLTVNRIQLLCYITILDNQDFH